jgi:hypothetical protein
MTLYTFQRMPAALQLTWALAKGTYLARRREEKAAIVLYYLPDGSRGFFAELSMDEGRGQAVVLRSFVSSGPLEDYAHGVRLPEG